MFELEDVVIVLFGFGLVDNLRALLLDQPAKGCQVGFGFALFADLYKRRDDYVNLHVSRDAGETWAIAEVPTRSHYSIQPIAFLARDDGMLVIGGKGLFLSTDHGKSWSQAAAPRALYQAAAACESGELYAAAAPTGLEESGGIYRSVDGGWMWERVLRREEVLSAVNPR